MEKEIASVKEDSTLSCVHYEMQSLPKHSIPIVKSFQVPKIDVKIPQSNKSQVSKGAILSQEWHFVGMLSQRPQFMGNIFLN